MIVIPGAKLFQEVTMQGTGHPVKSNVYAPEIIKE